MAQNEMKAKPALPERVRSMEGLGVGLLARMTRMVAGATALAVGIVRPTIARPRQRDALADGCMHEQLGQVGARLRHEYICGRCGTFERNAEAGSFDPFSWDDSTRHVFKKEGSVLSSERVRQIVIGLRPNTKESKRVSSFVTLQSSRIQHAQRPKAAVVVIATDKRTEKAVRNALQFAAMRHLRRLTFDMSGSRRQRGLGPE